MTPHGPEHADTIYHPGPAAARLPRAIHGALIAHARADYPNEACGLIVGTAPAAVGGAALRFEATRNRAASPYRYEIDPEDLYRVMVAADDADEVIWGIVHSHTHTPAVPSPTDIGLAFYPDALYLLVSLDPAEADVATGEPGVRAWRIVDGGVHEVALEHSQDADAAAGTDVTVGTDAAAGTDAATDTDATVGADFHSIVASASDAD